VTFGNGLGKGSERRGWRGWVAGKTVSDHMRDAIRGGKPEKEAILYVRSQCSCARTSNKRMRELYASLSGKGE